MRGLRIDSARVVRPLSGVERLLVGTLVAVAVAVRLPGTWSQSFWEDEVASARIIREPTLPHVLGQVVHTESTPPLWYVGVWLLHQGGMPIIDGRLVSVFLGGALTVAVVELARRFYSFPPALAAGALVALGAEFVGHGHELRAYELTATLSALFALCLLAQLAAPTPPHAAALATVVAASGLTHFFLAFSVIAAAAWLLGDPAVRQVRRFALRPIAIGSVVALGWLPLLFLQYHRGRFWWIGAFRLRPVIAVPLRLFSYAYSGSFVGLGLSVLGLVVVAAGGLRLARRSPAGRLVLVLALAPLAAAAIVWALGMPIFDLRNLIGIGAFVAVAAVAAVDALPRPAAWAVAATLVAFLGFSLPTVRNAWRIPPYAEMALRLVRDGWNGAQPIAVFGDPLRYKLPLEWYLPHQPTLDVERALGRQRREIFILHRSGRIALQQVRGRTSLGRSLRGAAFLVERAPRAAAHR